MREVSNVIGLALLLASTLAADAAEPAKKPLVNPPPTAQQWADLAKLPDWSGVWNPKVTDQDVQVRTNPPPWNPKAAGEMARMFAEEKAGRPRPLFVDCLPEGMPSWMLITHNAMEFALTPGRVTILGESDGNRLRRVYTDGRPHPDDPDPTFHGHSIGHWEGDTLVVDTVGILPQSYLAVSEAVGVPNNGDMHVIEHIHLQGMDFLHDDLEIIAPRILTTPWKTTRIFFRQRERKFEFVEGNCLQESFVDGLLEYPHYTRPQMWHGRTVPDTLVSGDHQRVRAWRRAQAELLTRERRPDLWERYCAAAPEGRQRTGGLT